MILYLHLYQIQVFLNKHYITTADGSVAQTTHRFTRLVCHNKTMLRLAQYRQSGY